MEFYLHKYYFLGGESKMTNNQEEVLALQEMGYDENTPEVISTLACAGVTALSAITAASVSAAWNSSLTLGCGK